jgi:cytochrome c oxidase subunit III
LTEHQTTVTVHEQFDDLEQQRLTYTLGMWVFLATEVLFFGGMFTLYSAYRYAYDDAFHAASRHMAVALGSINTAVLLLSSLTMALAVKNAHEDRRKSVLLFYLLTMALGTVFILIKAVEYTDHIEHHLWPGKNFSFPAPFKDHTELFFSLYFVMTGIHALHLLIGILVVGIMFVMVLRGRFSGAHDEPIELVGLYWHFVDIVWIFLFPLYYLLGFAR